MKVNGSRWEVSQWLVGMSSLIAVALAVAAGLMAGCLDRPVSKTNPSTSNVFVDQAVQSSVDKIDLLFMIDNSASMADKQDILQSAVPVLVNRLTSPICIDANGVPTNENSVLGKCTNGKPEFPPIADIHVGIVTSSLGSHGGGQVCAAGSQGTPNDAAHLLGTVRPAGSNADATLTFDVTKTWNNSGFLAWDPDKKDQPVPGESDAKTLQTSFKDMIAAAGEHGCGYEASLESWYRFLVDPEPPANVIKDASASPQTVRGSKLVINSDGSTTCTGCDQELLAQRKAFLRPDSLVAIIMLTDENDCSIRDDRQGWLVGTTLDDKKRNYYLPRSTAICATNPNAACCRSCGSAETAPPEGCMPLTTDPGCMAPDTQPDVRDATNLRCYDQKRRFGVDLLYPTSRYVDALSKTSLILQSDGKTSVPNPLFDSTGSDKRPRRASLVFLAGIVGVPWQDLADAPSLTGAGLKYLSASQLTESGRWSMLLGDPHADPPVPPSDPFMVESRDPRMGVNPVTMDAIMPASSTSQTASPINGHEQNRSKDPKEGDLQYACTFKLTKSKPCAPNDTNCDCYASRAADTNTPLCQAQGGTPSSYVQTYAKAYPGVRELQVLKDFNEQGIVASICPKVTESASPESDPNYGYNPAVSAIIDRLKIDLVGKCLPRKLETDPDTHQARCRVVEARPSGCDCTLPGRTALTGDAAAIIPAVQSELEASGNCGGPTQAACTSFCQCEVLQEEGAALAACQNDDETLTTPGYCYIDNVESPLVASCAPNQKRLLHFVDSPSNRIPANNAIAFIACLGGDIAPDGGSVSQ